MHHPYLVCIPLGMPSLSFFYLFSCNTNHLYKSINPWASVCIAFILLCDLSPRDCGFPLSAMLAPLLSRSMPWKICFYLPALCFKILFRCRKHLSVLALKKICTYVPAVSVEELQYFACIFESTACSPICCQKDQQFRNPRAWGYGNLSLVRGPWGPEGF